MRRKNAKVPRNIPLVIYTV